MRDALDVRIIEMTEPANDEQLRQKPLAEMIRDLNVCAYLYPNIRKDVAFGYSSEHRTVEIQ